MSSIKSALGYIPSKIALQQLNSDSATRRRSTLEFISARPQWFANVPRRVLASTKFGFPIWCDRWDVIGQTVIQTGQWEGLLSRTIQACLEPGDLALDVGANMGYDVMLMSQAVGENGTVVAFEPDLGNLQLLLENLKLLPHRNVIVQSIALADCNEIATIEISGEENRGKSNLRPNGGGMSQPVLTTRFDALFPQEIQKRIAFTKIDVEGFEHKVIDGMGAFLERIDVMTCEVDPKYLESCGTSARALFNVVNQHGFQSYCAQPNSDGKWTRSDADFTINAEHSQHFDALFCRRIPERLRPLIDS